MLTSDVQPLKADSATNVTFGKDVAFRDVQSLNAFMEICVSESNETLSSAKHPSKALVPIDVTPLAEMLFKEVQPAKHLLPMLVTESDIVTLLRFEHPEKAS